MEFAVKGFFQRDDFHHKLGCARFAFDTSEDVHPARGKSDPGLFANGDPIFRVCRRTHRHVAVLLDADWNGSPGAEAIRVRIEQHLTMVGWKPDDSAAIVIDPELENWIWLPHDTGGRALGWKSFAELHDFLRKRGLWSDGDKPYPPKDALELALRRVREPRSSKFYRKIMQDVPGVQRCRDRAFQQLRDSLRRWFPPETP